MKYIETTDAPQALGPYSQGVVAGNMLFISGQLAIDPTTNQLLTGDIKTQTLQILNNLAAICKAAGTSLNKIAKLTIYLQDLQDFAIVNATMAEVLSKPYPARETVQVAKLPLNATLEISAIVSV